MSADQEIDRISQAKSDIKAAIERKGVSVGDGRIDTYAQKIDQITGGGGYPEPTGTINITENGDNIDVKDYATANVNVSGGSEQPVVFKRQYESEQATEVSVTRANSETFSSQLPYLQILTTQGFDPTDLITSDGLYTYGLEISGTNYEIKSPVSLSYDSWDDTNDIFGNGIEIKNKGTHCVLTVDASGAHDYGSRTIRCFNNLNPQGSPIGTLTGHIYLIPASKFSQVPQDNSYHDASVQNADSTNNQAVGATTSFSTEIVNSTGWSGAYVAGIELNDASYYGNLTRTSAGTFANLQQVKYLVIHINNAQTAQEVQDTKLGLGVFIQDGLGGTIEEFCELIDFENTQTQYHPYAKWYIPSNASPYEQSATEKNKWANLIAQNPQTITFSTPVGASYTGIKVKMYGETETYLSQAYGKPVVIGINNTETWEYDYISSYVYALTQEDLDKIPSTIHDEGMW